MTGDPIGIGASGFRTAFVGNAALPLAVVAIRSAVTRDIPKPQTGDNNNRVDASSPGLLPLFGVRLRRHLLDVRRHVHIHLPGDPAQRSQHQALELRHLPDLFTMAHRGVENAPLAVHAGPGFRVGLPLVHRALHRVAVLRQDHVQVRGKVLQRVPLLLEAGVVERLGAGEPGIDALEDGRLLRHG